MRALCLFWCVKMHAPQRLQSTTSNRRRNQTPHHHRGPPSALCSPNRHSQATTLPLVGPLHSAGLPLLLGSTGALCVLLFGRPDAEPVRLWTVAAGQLASAAIAVAVFKAFGRGVAAKALAMAAALAAMMRIDAVHPPGGACAII